MSEALTACARASLDTDGFLVIAAALDRLWIAQLLGAFDDAPAQAHGTQHVAVTAETRHADAWEKLRTHRSAVAAADHIFEGGAFAVRELHGRNPLPGYGEQGLHADAAPRTPRERARPFQVVTALFALDDLTVENGATRVVPGTHLRTQPIPKAFAQPMARHPEERVLTAAAGSLLLLNGHTWHAARRNDSRGPRRVVQMVMRRA